MSSLASERQYFDWLLRRVGAEKHISLCLQLYETDFNWFVPNDDNRAEDGKMLRREFLDEFNHDDHWIWSDRKCSMLELILGISLRLSYDTEYNADIWFWEILQNLNLTQYKDEYYDRSVDRHVSRVLEKVNDRTYTRKGFGGLFPLNKTNEDQRKVEIWYQMSAYLLENNHIS